MYKALALCSTLLFGAVDLTQASRPLVGGTTQEKELKRVLQDPELMKKFLEQVPMIIEGLPQAIKQIDAITANAMKQLAESDQESKKQLEDWMQGLEMQGLDRLDENQIEKK